MENIVHEDRKMILSWQIHSNHCDWLNLTAFTLPSSFTLVLIIAGATKPRISKNLNVQGEPKNMAALTL